MRGGHRFFKKEMRQTQEVAVNRPWVFVEMHGSSGGNKLRIAQVAPLAESVPPKLYGGTERVVSWLTEELVDLGHDVTLFASGNSATRARLVSVWPRALRLGRPACDPVAAQAAQLEAMAERASDFDVIHFHTDWLHLPLLRRLQVPYLTTMHGRLDLPNLDATVSLFPDAPFVSISENQPAPLPRARWLGTIYHGLPGELLRPCLEPAGYLAFLGRIVPEKGPEVAIRIARACGLPLRIAAKIPRAENRYFKEHIEPLLDGSQVEFVGEVNDREKQDFLGKRWRCFSHRLARALRPVMIEAMACGTRSLPGAAVPSRKSSTRA